MGLGLLLVCNLPMFSLKIKSLSPKVAYKQWLLVFGVLAALILWDAALWFIMGWYIHWPCFLVFAIVGGHRMVFGVSFASVAELTHLRLNAGEHRRWL